MRMQIKTILKNSLSAFAQDLIGATSLVVILVGSLHLPGFLDLPRRLSRAIVPGFVRPHVFRDRLIPFRIATNAY